MLGIVKSHIIVSWLFFLWSVTVPHDAIVYGQIITTPTSDNASSIPVSSPTPSPTTPIIQVTTEAATTTKPDPKPVPPLNIVFGQVGRNASVPCFIDALAVYPDKMLSTTWKKNRMFIVNAAMGEDGKLSLSYLDDELKKKYEVEEDYSLVVTELEMKDTTNFTCTVIKFQTDQRLVHDVIYTNITYLLVQDVPSPPGRPSILEKSSRTAKISWSPSQTDNNSPIMHYSVNVMDRTMINQGRSHFSSRHRWNNMGVKVKQVSVFTNENPSAVLTGLHPYTAYQITVSAVNKIGTSIESQLSDIFYTDSEAPEAPPLHLVATSNFSSRIHLSWDPPPLNKHHGNLEGYRIQYTSERDGINRVITVEDPKKTKITLFGLQPFEAYEVSVLAFNNIGEGPAVKKLIRTAEGIPGKPLMIHTNTQPMSTSFVVKWLAPDQVNGHIMSYELRWQHNNITKTKVISKYLNNPMLEQVTNLKPFTQYRVQVRAITGGGKGEFSDVYPVYTDVAGPSSPEVTNLTVLGSRSIYISWEPPKQFYRTIDHYYIQIIDTSTNHQQRRALENNERETIVTGLPTNTEFTLKIAGVTKSLHSNMHYIGEFSKPWTFSLSELSEDEMKEVRKYLPGNHSIVNFTSISFPTRPPEIQEPIMEDPTAVNQADSQVVNAGIVAGVVCTIIFILLAVLGFIGCRSMTCRKYYQAAYNYLAVPTNNNSPPSTVIVVADPADEQSYNAVKEDLEKRFTTVRKEDFLQHVQSLHADSDVGFSHEFDEINKLTSVTPKAEVGMYPENKQKNRYVNIQAFDHSRVVLQKSVQVRQRQSDYINANYIDGYKKSKAYIATQGPMPNTFADFWRMVWEQNSVVIVMITKLVERTRRKCDQYWPEDGIETYGNIQVKHVNTFSRAHYTVRIFSLKNVKLKKQFSERIVHQFHYTEWPDHGVPDFTLPVLKFVQKSAALNPIKAGPIVVHCSAGVGRTGTYILIDSMIEQIKDQGTVAIPSFLLKIRQQRNFLVQTEDQYMLVHDALVEYLLCPTTEIKQSDVKVYTEKLAETPLDIMPSLLQNIFLIVTAYKPKDSDKSLALAPLALEKNRNTNFIPLYPKRVKLPFLPGVEGSDYINATYLQGYNHTDEFILTQHPLETTVGDFWRMVWDNNSSVIVLLSRVDDEEFMKFWPDETDSVGMDTANFKLVFQESEEGNSYTVHTFLLESTQDDYVLMTQIISCPEWPPPDLPHYKAFDLLERVKELQAQKDGGPIVVVDRFGGVEGARFCILSSLLDQLNHDKTIDVYHLCKLYHKKRPGIVGSQEDYLFIFLAMNSYIQEQFDKETASLSHHLHLRSSSAKKNGTLSRSPTLQAKVETTI
ncbi:tyrosine-protein phosphatase 99A-like isoform X3 [Ostrea edulis]|uniref:tyrosine-protein phosphatase 99A-like isoform X3 n=1 Tax=Ostrea edulis TaxID=37623 RepID=UPI0024AED524|nr:tyrosine-protein phosphatase 99A-like isoform X3 [Ostrea edulis]